MITVPLSIRPCNKPQLEAAAWFISGSDPSSWLSELATWGVPTAGLDLYLLPNSVRDRRPCGVLVVPPAGPPPAPSCRPIPYGRIGRRLFIPANARLVPAFSAKELDDTLVADMLVFHPGFGLIGFSRADRRGVKDLVDPPPLRRVNWDRAIPGLFQRPRLVSVEPEVAETVQSILDSGRDDIAAQPLDGLPEAPNEPGNSLLHRAGRAVQQKLAQGIHGLANQLAGKGSTKPSWRERLRQWAMRQRDKTARGGKSASGAARATGAWLGRIGARAANWIASIGRRSGPGKKAGAAGSAQQGPTWAERFRSWTWHKLQAVTAAMEAARNREIHRLLHLFDSDPEQALRYAPPFSGVGGVPSGPPGIHLTPRSTEFKLGGLGGWHTFDPWSIDWQMRQRLLQKYRELADREVRLGRHRRAAYILAELLGDFAAAAAVLAQGKHFREAAILYRDRVKRPLEAARCLDQAGLWAEAVAIYEAEGEFEKAGDLYSRLQQPGEAEREYRRAVARLQQQEDLFGAARLLDCKLAAHDEALSLLGSAWPWSKQAGKCLELRFELLGKLGRHQDSREMIAQLVSAAPPSNRSVILVQVMAQAARRYPDQVVRAAAADATRVIAGQLLAQPAMKESDSIVAAVVSLEPHDRLLGRDGRRFQAQKSLNSITPPTALRAPNAGATQLRTFYLPRGVTWKAAAAAGNVFCAAGIAEGKMSLLRGDWFGDVQQISWDEAVDEDDCIMLALDPQGVHTTWIHCTTPSSLLSFKFGHRVRFPFTEQFPRAMIVGSPQPEHPSSLRAVAYGDNGLTWILDGPPDRLTLYGIRSDGSRVTSRHVPVPADELLQPENRSTFRACLLVHRDTFYIGLGRHLLTMVRDHPIVTSELPSPVTGLAGTWPLTRPRIAVTHQYGGLVVWGGLNRGYSEAFQSDRGHPRAAFTRDGTLVVLSSGEGHLYDTHARKVSFRARFEARVGDLVAILPTAAVNEFALLGTNGRMDLFRV